MPKKRIKLSVNLDELPESASIWTYVENFLNLELSAMLYLKWADVVVKCRFTDKLGKKRQFTLYYSIVKSCYNFN